MSVVDMPMLFGQPRILQRPPVTIVGVNGINSANGTFIVTGVNGGDTATGTNIGTGAVMHAFVAYKNPCSGWPKHQKLTELIQRIRLALAMLPPYAYCGRFYSSILLREPHQPPRSPTRAERDQYRQIHRRARADISDLSCTPGATFSSCTYTAPKNDVCH